LLVIVNLSSKDQAFPMETLSSIDSALTLIGLRRQVRSVMVPGREYTVTYDGPMITKERIEEVITPLAKQNNLTFTVETEESVSFP